jgi:pimeloyl-ACP methyl ester carboxylesterase
MQISANGIQIEIDDQGPPGGEPLLLVMGLGMQLIAWPQDMVNGLVAQGFRVLRLDNRDAGLSQGFDAWGTPGLLGMGMAALKHRFNLPVASPYGLGDMAADALGVLDALGIARAHVCGASMGGMIVQHLAARYPQRVKSLTLMMTTSGARHLPQASGRVQRALLTRPRGRDTASIVRHLQGLMQLIGSPAHPTEPALLQQRLQASVERAWRPQGTTRQLLAIVADGDRSALLRGLQLPTGVVHGDADPLVPPAAGRELAQLIPGASLDLVPGMGHDLPPALVPRFVQRIAHTAARAA